MPRMVFCSSWKEPTHGIMDRSGNCELRVCRCADRQTVWEADGTTVQRLSQTLPLACGDWANTKAAYRFLDNDCVSEAEILPGHFQSTQVRLASVDGPILVPHDTTSFSLTRSDTEAIGQTHRVASGHKCKTGRRRVHTVAGFSCTPALW